MEPTLTALMSQGGMHCTLHLIETVLSVQKYVSYSKDFQSKTSFVFQILIEAGVELEHATDTGFTPLHVATEHNHVEIAQVSKQ